MNEKKLTVDLMRFLESVLGFLRAGYELRFAWEGSCKLLETELSHSFTKMMRKESASMVFVLRELGEHFPIVRYRPWFSAIEEHYTSGCQLLPAVRAFAHFVREEREQLWAQHVRTLPVRLNVALLLFFLPAALWLLLWPLLSVFTGAF